VKVREAKGSTQGVERNIIIILSLKNVDPSSRMAGLEEVYTRRIL
jgi:hypothetical protein